MGRKKGDGALVSRFNFLEAPHPIRIKCESHLEFKKKFNIKNKQVKVIVIFYLTQYIQSIVISAGTHHKNNILYSFFYNQDLKIQCVFDIKNVCKKHTLALTTCQASL